MNAVELRNLNFEQLRASLESGRREVFEGYVRFGPATTRHLAEWIGWDVLSVRPRVCELAQMGLLKPCGEHRAECRGRIIRETIYRAATLEEFEATRALRVDGQLKLI